MGERPGRNGVLVAVVLVGACSPVFRGEASQPNPIAEPTETLRESEPIDVITSDMDLEVPEAVSEGARVSLMHMHHYPLHNVAQFTVVSRDRLRFHVQLEHKWQEWADLNNWQAHLEDDQGHRWEPEGLDHATTRVITHMWDRELRSVQRAVAGTPVAHDQFGDGQVGDVSAINNDGWKNVQTLGSLSIFRGRGDFVFYQRDLLTPACRWLKLVVVHPGESFEFTWNFEDDAAVGDVITGPSTAQ